MRVYPSDMTSASQNWSFGQIAAVDPQRASALEDAPSRVVLADAITTAFGSALTAGSARLGLEESGSNEGDIRTVLQFHVGAELFDRFFNARTGYRAQFWRGWETGLAFNFGIISALREAISDHAAPTVTVQRLSASFEYRGAMSATAGTLAASLEPALSKIWFCTRLMRDDADPAQLPLGLTGPRLVVADGVSWVAPFRDETNAWLDVKGAFLSATGPYQPKDPATRAKRLQSSGDA